jgi:hypothetical protein
MRFKVLPVSTKKAMSNIILARSMTSWLDVKIGNNKNDNRFITSATINTPLIAILKVLKVSLQVYLTSSKELHLVNSLMMHSNL